MRTHFFGSFLWVTVKLLEQGLVRPNNPPFRVFGRVVMLRPTLQDCESLVRVRLVPEPKTSKNFGLQCNQMPKHPELKLKSIFKNTDENLANPNRNSGKKNFRTGQQPKQNHHQKTIVTKPVLAFRSPSTMRLE
jgi:ribosomal protein L44E